MLINAYHGSTRSRTIYAGGRQFRRTERYCEVHGWFDTFLFPDEQWRARHADCGKPRAGATVSARTMGATPSKPGLPSPNTFGTGHFTEKQRAELALVADSQEGVIYGLLKRHSAPWGASAIEAALSDLRWPLTSIRRALTCLKKKGLVRKTGKAAVGRYGRNENLWEVNR